MTDTQSPDQPAATPQDMADAALQEQIAELEAVQAHYRKRATMLNVEIRVRDRMLAERDTPAPDQEAAPDGPTDPLADWEDAAGGSDQAADTGASDGASGV